jgi:hypothetical protein
MSKRRVIVIGEGPAGLMAAGQAAEDGAETLLLGKMDRPGCKLRLTGNGRCNLTNTDPLPEFISHFRPDGRFLRQALSHFFSADLRAFFDRLGVPTVVEQNRFVFPASGKAADVVNALIRWIQQKGVTLQLMSPVEKLIVEQKRIIGVQASQKNRTKHIYHADAVIIATGGASYPSTGSSGDGFRLAQSVGHTIVPVRPALVPLETTGNIAQKLQGLSLNNVKITVLANEKKITQTIGEILFTHFGLSGPAILSLSGSVVDELTAGKKITITIDLITDVNESQLETLLIRKLSENGRKHLSSLIKTLLPARLCEVCCKLNSISPEKQAGQVTAAERKKLKTWLKNFRLDITGHRGFNEAMITAGGVSTKEIDPRTMASRLIKGLYFAGEVLDIDGDTGGYNLQAAFSTARLAAKSVAINSI